MNPFEIHITGNFPIIEELNRLYKKNITVALLTPTGEVHRIEYMSSFIQKYDTLGQAVDATHILVQHLKSAEIIRVKIESPYDEYYTPMCLYIESHFLFDGKYDYPVSKNIASGKMMCTDRCYDKSQYGLVANKWMKEDKEVEMCVYDSFQLEDEDWFALYKN